MFLKIFYSNKTMYDTELTLELLLKKGNWRKRKRLQVMFNYGPLGFYLHCLIFTVIFLALLNLLKGV